MGARCFGGGIKILAIIDRYVLGRVLGVMLSTLLVGVLLLSMVRMVLILKSDADIAHAFFLVIELTVLFMPHYLGFMLPFALFSGIYVTVRRMSLDRELVSLHASGMSLSRFIRPLVLLGVFLTVANTLVLGWLEPLGRYSYRELAFRIEHVAPYLAIREGVFTTIGRQTIYIEHIDQATRTFKNIFVFQPERDGSQTEIIAASGEVFVGNHLPQLLLHDGNRLIVQQNALSGPAQPETPQNLTFQTLTFPLAAPSLRFHQRGDDEQEFSLLELYERLDTPPAGTLPAEMVSELNRKLAIILTALFLPLAATLLARSNPRGSNLYQGLFSFGFIILYQQLIQFGSVMIERTGVSPAISIWPVFGVMAAGSLILLGLQDTMTGRPSELPAIVLQGLLRKLRGPFSLARRGSAKSL